MGVYFLVMLSFDVTNISARDWHLETVAGIRGEEEEE